MSESHRDVDELRTQIETLILRDTGDFFDAAEDRSTLEVTVRICCEFLDFLLNAEGEAPDSSDASYIADTIRSGLDEFFTMAQWGRILKGLRLSQGFEAELPQTFVAFRAKYDATFQELLRCDASVAAFGRLLSLTQLMILFLAVYFPVYLSYSPGDEGAEG
jgi:hypothetical protein